MSTSLVSLQARSRVARLPKPCANTLHNIDLDGYKSHSIKGPNGEEAEAIRSRLGRHFYQIYPGRSPEADKIYKKYVEIYSDINAKIGEIDKIPNPTDITKVDRAKILEQQAKLGPIFQKDYDDATAKEQTFIDDTAKIVSTIEALYQEAIGGDSIHGKIQLDYLNAQGIVQDVSPKLAQDQSLLDSLQTLEATIASLQTQINQLPVDPKRIKAQADLDATKAALAPLESAIQAAQPNLSIIQRALDAITAQGGELGQLKALAELPDPQQKDLESANGLLTTVQILPRMLAVFETGEMAAVNQNLSIVKDGISKVQRDLQPAPVPGKIENGCWYIDWTAWEFPVPKGVNAINIFVGKIDLVDGLPTIGGFGNISLERLQAFVKQCQAQQPPIAVKVSIGGGGGSYDDCWKVLTEQNVQGFAKVMAEFCHTYGLAGIDFDFEGAGPADLVGTLIQKFKAIDPKLQTSLCTNAGFGPYFPCQERVNSVLKAAKDPVTGKCALDRLYVMSYYNPLDQEKGWMQGWTKWVKDEYGLDASQVTFGIDDFDAHAYDITDAARYAKEAGNSTSYWTWNPATPAVSDASSTKIWTAYNQTEVTALRVVLFFISLLLGPLSLLIGLIYLALIKDDKKSTSIPVAMTRPALTVPSAPPAEPTGSESSLAVGSSSQSRPGKTTATQYQSIYPQIT